MREGGQVAQEGDYQGEEVEQVLSWMWGREDDSAKLTSPLVIILL